MDPQEIQAGATTRERQIEFMASRGRDAFKVAIAEAFAINGPDWLTDEQLREIVSRRIRDERYATHMAIRNRAHYAATLGANAA